VAVVIHYFLGAARDIRSTYGASVLTTSASGQTRYGAHDDSWKCESVLKWRQESRRALVRQHWSFSDTIAAGAVSRRAKGVALTTAKVLRGAPVARRVRLEVETAARSFIAETGNSPTLATVLAGSAPPSSAYRDAISQAMGACGIDHVDVLLPVAATTGRIVESIERLNERDDVHGIIVLLPLPPHVQVLDVVSSIAPTKDVDGISPTSVGRLHLGLPTLYPSTPLAGLEILDHYQIPVAGKRAVVVGRGNVVGKPMAALLTARDATVTLCHSRTVPLENETRMADIVVLAAGHPGLLTGRMITPGVTVVDFGVNVAAGRIIGDADAESVAPVAGAYTPVPGGTTPVTTMALARNTVTAAYAQVGELEGPASTKRKKTER
jgi:methylenetetrahydrofolate dehydrogenase (NADP+) / methenyltetrahydrofolate cyclohydrolase